MNSLIVKVAKRISRVCNGCVDKTNLYSNVTVRTFVNLGDKIPINFMKGTYFYINKIYRCTMVCKI